MKKNLLALLFAVIALAACDKEETTITKDASSYTIEGYVVDADGNVPMEGVVVKGAFGDTETDEEGYFVIKGLKHGSYSVIFAAESYGTMIYTYAIEPIANTPLEVNYSKSVVVSMYQMNEDLETKLWKSIDNKREVLANVPYTIELGENFLYNKIKGMTDENGSVSALDTLPNASVTLIVEYVSETEEKVYELRSESTPKAFEKSYAITGIDMSETLFLINSNIFDSEGGIVSDFSVTSPVSFTFNKSVEEIEDVILTNLSDSRKVAVEVSVSGSSVSIDAIGNLESAANYRIKFNAISGDATEAVEFDFTTEGGVTSLGQVVGLSRRSKTDTNQTIEVYENETAVTIEFIRPVGAKTFEVYAKYGDQSEFQLAYQLNAGTDVDDTKEVHTLSKLNSSLPDMDVPGSGMFADGKTYTIIIRALNSDLDLIGNFSSELVIKKTADYPVAVVQ